MGPRPPSAERATVASRKRQVAALTVFVGQACGCGWIFPLESRSPNVDGGDSRDSSVDARSPSDAAADAGPDDPTDAAADARLDDAGEDCDPPPDAGAGPVCGQPPVPCPGPCVPSDDADCDGLPSARDSWPAHHDAPVFFDDFASDPTEGGLWAVPPTAEWSEDARRLSLPPGEPLAMSADCADALPDAGFLVELAFSAASFPGKTSWWVRVGNSWGPGEYDYCALWRELGLFGARPHARTGREGSGYLSDGDPHFDAAVLVDQLLLLQFWWVWDAENTRTSLSCRVLSLDGEVLSEAGHTGSAAPGSGVVDVETSGLTIEIEHVRVLEVVLP